MAQQTWVALANTPPITGQTFNTFTTAQDISSASVAGGTPTKLQIPGNFMLVGQSWRFTWAGTYGTTATPNLTIGITLGTTNIASTAFTTASGVAAGQSLFLQAYATVRAIGSGTATASIITQGTLFVQNVAYANPITNAAVGLTLPFPGNGAPSAVTGWDSTASNPLIVTAAWSASSASNTITTNLWLAEYLN